MCFVLREERLGDLDSLLWIGDCDIMYPLEPLSEWEV